MVVEGDSLQPECRSAGSKQPLQPRLQVGRARLRSSDSTNSPRVASPAQDEAVREDGDLRQPLQVVGQHRLAALEERQRSRGAQPGQRRARADAERDRIAGAFSPARRAPLAGSTPRSAGLRPRPRRPTSMHACSSERPSAGLDLVQRAVRRAGPGTARAPASRDRVARSCMRIRKRSSAASGTGNVPWNSIGLRVARTKNGSPRRTATRPSIARSCRSPWPPAGTTACAGWSG